jgi:hypothetical protein
MSVFFLSCLFGEIVFNNNYPDYGDAIHGYSMISYHSNHQLVFSIVHSQ